MIAGLAAALIVGWTLLHRPEHAEGPERRPRSPGSGPSIAAPIDPGNAEAWVIRIDRLRVEDRTAEARAVGVSALAAVAPDGRREVLRALTLALLAVVPEDQARGVLQARIGRDPNDLDARVALVRLDREAGRAAPADRPRVGRPATSPIDPIDTLEAMLLEEPDHLGVREALADALLDQGRVGRARSVFEGWPAAQRDDRRRLRLRARFDLDHDDRPERAVEALGRLLRELPEDWRTRARLASALERSGLGAEARAQARLVDRHREVLEPSRLGPRLASDLQRLNDPKAAADLARLCAAVGLDEVAAAWRRLSTDLATVPERSLGPVE